MFLGGDTYVRKDKLVAGDPVLEAGRKRDPNVPLVDNGIEGDPRLSTPELGKLDIELKSEAAVKEIKQLLGSR